MDESGQQSCLYSVVDDTGLSCKFHDLTNGESYRFQARALNGAGWGPWSAWSDSVTPEPPPVAKSIVITGSRKGRIVKVDGVTTGLVPGSVQAWVRLRGQTGYAPGATRELDAQGSFTWQRTTGKKVYVVFRDGDVKSNRVIIKP